MSEKPKQEWRIEGDKFGVGSHIWLNGEELFCVMAVNLSIHPGHLTQLTLELAPNHVQVVTDPKLSLIVGEHRFQVIEDNSGNLDEGLLREPKVDGESINHL